MFELRPMNKHIIIDPIAEDEKIAGGLLYRPGSALGQQHRMATVVAVSKCEELGDIRVGDRVLYDTIGSISHRVGNQSFTSVKVLNVIAIVSDKAEATLKFSDIVAETD
jgi:co-chaperonin GroES (HSP10)